MKYSIKKHCRHTGWFLASHSSLLPYPALSLSPHQRFKPSFPSFLFFEHMAECC